MGRKKGYSHSEETKNRMACTQRNKAANRPVISRSDIIKIRTYSEQDYQIIIDILLKIFPIQRIIK